jgi:hypothetical protein
MEMRLGHFAGITVYLQQVSVLKEIAGIADPAVIHTRRHRYMENRDYLSFHGIDPGRLATILGGS